MLFICLWNLTMKKIDLMYLLPQDTDICVV